jgi:hypothetical protein
VLVGCSYGGDTGDFLVGNGRLLVLLLLGCGTRLVRPPGSIGTLLGPETTSNMVVLDEIQILLENRGPLWSLGLGVEGLGLVLVENCTVDASIFKALWSSC